VPFFKATWSYPAVDFKKGEQEVEKMVKRLSDSNFNLIIPAVKDEAGIFVFKTDKGKRYPMVDEWDPLKVLVDKAHEYDLKVHTWLCVFRDGPQSVFLEKNPQFAARDKDGNPIKGGWVCPARKEVQEHELSLYVEVMEKYDIDGVHLDYIRYAGPEMCFCDYCVNTFMKEHGVDIRKLTSRDDAWETWVEWRIGIITSFVERLREEAKSRGREVSAAVFSAYPICIESVGQDWVSWGKKGLVDYLFPMTYTQLVRLVSVAATIHKHLIGDACFLAEGLAPWLPLTTKKLVAEIEECLKAGVKGVVFYHYGSITDEMLEAIKELDKKY